MTTDELIVRREGSAGFLSLNRPKAIHALTQGMVRAMTAALLAWKEDSGVAAVLLDHAEGRGFCSGGDINLLRESVLTDGGAHGREFFYEEYQLNHLLMTYAKPVVAFMDGIVMGGGVGIAQPARYRVVTENTRFAMPETGIGLFPDVGGGWHLSRLPGRVGQFLALTGARFDGAECLWAGLATHYLPAAVLPEAKARIAAGEDIAAVLDALSEAPPSPRAAGNAELIARHFASDRLEDVIAGLEGDGGEWAARELATLRAKSPQTCKVALRQLRESLSCADFAANMAMEYRIASRVLTLPDFAEGVRAVIVDKDNAPRWNPATPEGVTEGLLDSIFAPLPAGEEWRPLN
ncbi:MAG: enoyl-CoA hydratase/isomerase family protein [Sphingomonadales bacterium]|nr:enoyl-CoA hydratase/isomerase family protein [Sphingomonadales bacterium]